MNTLLLYQGFGVYGTVPTESRLFKVYNIWMQVSVISDPIFQTKIIFNLQLKKNKILEYIFVAASPFWLFLYSLI
jgi:hypothetical protein